ncbi:hypothetical protein Yangon190_13390 [Helicobacter pylori]
MRHRNETATSFNKLKEITQAIQTQKNSAQTSDNANTSEITSQSAQTSDNANTSEITSQSAPKPTAHAKKSALKPTKRAFSDRQKTTIRDNSKRGR